MSSIFVRDSWNLCKESMHWLPRYFAAATGVLSSPNLSHCCVAARNAVTRCLRTFANLPRDLRALARIAVTEAMLKTGLEAYTVASPKVFSRLEWRIRNQRFDPNYEENVEEYVSYDICSYINWLKETCLQFLECAFTPPFLCDTINTEEMRISLTSIGEIVRDRESQQ